MHSILTRSNAILAYTVSVAACLTLCCFLSTGFLDYRANATLNTVKVVVYVPMLLKKLLDSGFDNDFSACLTFHSKINIIFDRTLRFGALIMCFNVAEKMSRITVLPGRRTIWDS